MTEPIELALPCRLVSLEVSLASDDELSTLENLVAKAVLLGCRSVGKIKSLFGLPERLASDIVTSMWEKGFLVVDLEEGVFDLSEAARSSLTDGGSIASGPRNETQTYIFEPLSGLVLPEDDRNHDIGHRARHDSLKVPVDGVVRPDDIAEEELIRGVQVAVNRRREWGRRENVLRVSFGNRLLRPPNLVRWLHIQATITKDVHSRTWSVAVNHRGWDTEAQLRLGRRLQRLLDEAPDSEFARTMNRRAAVELHSRRCSTSCSRRWRAALARWNRRRLGSCGCSTRTWPAWPGGSSSGSTNSSARTWRSRRSPTGRDRSGRSAT